MNNTRKLIEETLKLRAKANTGDDALFYFRYHSYHNIEKLCKALEVALDALEHYDNDMNWENEEVIVDPEWEARKAMNKIESIITGGGE